MTAVAIQESDLRYKGRDRSAYLAYLLKQGKRANAAVWDAQKAFIDRELSGDTQTSTGLDPVLTVDPDGLALEVFSRDESAYARLTFDPALFDALTTTPGTAFVRMPQPFVDKLDRLRSYLPVALDIAAGRMTPAPATTPATRTATTPGPAATSAPATTSAPTSGPATTPATPTATTSAPETTSATPAAPTTPTAIERTASVPDAWLRSFLQVQSAATLPSATCEIAPVDLYNALYVLSVRKAKKAPRALRFELVPGQPPRVVLEPWNIVLEGHGPAFQGRTPRVVRTYGRQRLMLFARLLPHIKRARVELLGPGLPVFWVLDLGLATLTIGLTGWTEAAWSGAAAFDQLVPPPSAGPLADAVLAHLRAHGPTPIPALSAALGATPENTRAALQRACLRGGAVFDVARHVVRPRALFAEPIDDELVRFGSPREARAHRLLEAAASGSGAVKITKVHAVVGEGVEIRGEVIDAEARRTLAPRFQMDLEGRVTDASCNCPTFARAGLREGPCEHLLALRVAHSRERAAEEAMRDTPEGRARIRAETRTLVRRDAAGAEHGCRVSLDGRRVRVVRTTPDEAARHRNLVFDTESDARDEYFAELDALGARGFIDAGDALDAGSAAGAP